MIILSEWACLEYRSKAFNVLCIFKHSCVFLLISSFMNGFMISVHENFSSLFQLIVCTTKIKKILKEILSQNYFDI